jgi:hypothetical protein
MVRIGTRPFGRAITVAVIPALLLLGSCSKSVSPVCSDAQNLKDAVQGLTQVDVTTGGVAALQTAVDDVKSAAAALGTEAKSTFGTQVSAIQAQITALGGEIDQVTAGASVVSVAPAVASSLSQLKTALSDLESTAQSQDCNLK